MNTQDQSQSLVDILAENGLSAEALANTDHPDHYSQKEVFVRLFNTNQIDLKKLEALAAVLPQALEKIGAISNDAKASQIEALRAFRESNEQDFKVIEKIIETAETEDLRREALQAAERISAGKRESVTYMSNDNNSFFKRAATVVLGGLILIAAGTAAAKALSR